MQNEATGSKCASSSAVVIPLERYNKMLESYDEAMRELWELRNQGEFERRDHTCERQ